MLGQTPKDYLVDAEHEHLHCSVSVPLKPVPSVYGVSSEMITLVKAFTPCLDRREVSLMGGTKDVKVPMVALKTHVTTGHVTENRVEILS